MKRLVLLLAMSITCIGISAQSLEDKVRREVERQRPKHNQPKKGNSDTQAAAVAAQQAAIATQANLAVANAQQQAQYIDQTYTAEGLTEQYSKKPKVPAGPHTATSFSQKNKIGVRFGKGAGKANETINIVDENSKNNTPQSQWGTIGGDGNSYKASYKNAEQFKDKTQQEQNRAQRTPTKTTNTNPPMQVVNNSPESTKYPSPKSTTTKEPATQGTQHKSGSQQTKDTPANGTTSQVASDNTQQEVSTSHKPTPVKDVKKQMSCKNHIVRIEGPYDVLGMNKRFQELSLKAMEDMANNKVPQIPVPKKRVDKQYDIIISTNPTCLKK